MRCFSVEKEMKPIIDELFRLKMSMPEMGESKRIVSFGAGIRGEAICHTVNSSRIILAYEIICGNSLSMASGVVMNMS